uniref:Uncharacterized protein n=1 Tax=Rhizophora mucronata TaxID=61149 RepID=A0A2P2PLM4_RHIMU
MVTNGHFLSSNLLLGLVVLPNYELQQLNCPNVVSGQQRE